MVADALALLAGGEEEVATDTAVQDVQRFVSEFNGELNGAEGFGFEIVAVENGATHGFGFFGIWRDASRWETDFTDG